MRHEKIHRISLSLALVSMLVGISGCSTNPATGKSQLVLVGEQQEVALGLENAKQVDASMGLYDNQALQDYVNNLGLSLASKSERPNLPWRFAVVDDDVVNAFALPGGFIYVTRGILSHFNSEAELAAVVGHEIGHVTGRHSVEQMSRAQLAQIGLVAGSVLYQPIQNMAGSISQGLGLLFLKYGRDDEREADELGVRYMTRDNYDPNAAVSVFDMLARQTAASGGRGVPEWLATHPTPENRSARLRELIAANPTSADRVERESYLNRLDGLVFGKDPRNGFFKDSRFLHPAMAFELTFPNGWQTQNLAQAVVAQHPEGAAAMQLTLASGESHQEAARSFFSQQGLQAAEIKTRKINGLPATTGLFKAQGQQGVITGTATFIDHGGKTFQIVGMTSEQNLRSFVNDFSSTSSSFRRVTDRSILNVKPQRIELIRLDRSESITQLRARRRSPVKAEKLAIINGVDANQAIPKGTLIKWVL